MIDNCARSAAGGAEPRRRLGEQILPIFTDPGHVSVRPQQRAWEAEVRSVVSDVHDMVDPIRPARHREPPGLSRSSPRPRCIRQ